jgi:3-isopropylmalate/(R)-2-methylmalate dehydratase large subunit
VPRTLYDKIWDQHLVSQNPDGTSLIYVDRHLVHEVSSAQAFEGLRSAGLAVRRPDRTLAVLDHNIPTRNRHLPNPDPLGERQSLTLAQNAREHGIKFFGAEEIRQGIVHVVGPEQGFTLPGTIVACGDSHTATHGALGALGLGIGTSEVEHILATQTLLLRKSRNMLVRLLGKMPTGVTAKDIALHLTGKISMSGAADHVIEYAGPAVTRLSIEERMTICNMSIEAGARSALIAPDAATIAYVNGRPMAPLPEHLPKAIHDWQALFSDLDAHFDKVIDIDTGTLIPTVTWGTSPDQIVGIDGTVPYPNLMQADRVEAARRALEYMDLKPGQPISGTRITDVFIGSCTNGRIEDLRSAARILRHRRKADWVRVLIVPGSGLVRQQAEREGLDQVFLAAGCEWRDPGCSMCLGMNADQLAPGARCASTSNRNFVGRQGRGSRTHLMSPAMAAAAAVTGMLTDVRKIRPL